jgi:hypothetical protein
MRDAREPLAIGATVEVNGVTWQRIQGLEEDQERNQKWRLNLRDYT